MLNFMVVEGPSIGCLLHWNDCIMVVVSVYHAYLTSVSGINFDLKSRKLFFQVIIQGFRSYRDQTIIEPFSPKHNIIGRCKNINVHCL